MKSPGLLYLDLTRPQATQYRRLELARKLLRSTAGNRVLVYGEVHIAGSGVVDPVAEGHS